MVERVSSEDDGSAPPIPPRTNEMYLLEHRNSERGTTCANYIPASDDQTRDCFISEAHIAERGSDTESMSAWIEDAKTEVDRDMEFPEDTVSEHFTALRYGQFEHSSMCESFILLSSLQLFTPIRNGICHLRKRTE